MHVHRHLEAVLGLSGGFAEVVQDPHDDELKNVRADDPLLTHLDPTRRGDPRPGHSRRSHSQRAESPRRPALTEVFWTCGCGQVTESPVEPGYFVTCFRQPSHSGRAQDVEHHSRHCVRRSS